MLTSQIKVIRLETNDICTMGAILINGRLIAMSLEPPKFGNTQDLSCIPCDTYKYLKRYSAKHKYEIIELQNVFNRSAVQIHIGNKPNQTSGCILPGLAIQTHLPTFVDPNKFTYVPEIHSSKKAHDLILSLTTPEGILTIIEAF